MPEFEENGFKGVWLPGRRLNGDHGIVVVAKRRFDVDQASGSCEDAEETPGVMLGPEYTNPDDPAYSSVAKPGELAAQKPKVDILVRANAHAPGGEPTAEWEVGIRIPGVLDRRLRIVGPRVALWVPPKKWITDKERAKGEEQEWSVPRFSKPRPIAKLPLRYEYAFGGVAKMVLEEHVLELAAEAQAAQKERDDAKARKKEIEEELKAEEEAKAKEAAGGDAPQGDAVAAEKAAEAFGGATGSAAAGGASSDGSGTQVIDADTLARLADADEGDGMVAASPFRLGKDMPDRPDARGPTAGEALVDAGADPDASDEADDGAVADPLAGVFTEGTAMLDVSALGAGADELQASLEQQSIDKRGRLRDAEGTLLVRTDGMADVKLSDDEWIAQSAEPEAEAAPPREDPEEEPYPTVPFAGNPAGRGYCVSPLEDAVHNLDLPCIEYVDKPLRPTELVQDLTQMDLAAIPAAPGFGVYSMGWFPRASLAGCMPWDEQLNKDALETALEQYDPDDPDDQLAIETIRNMKVPILQAGWFNDAHQDLQVERLAGDESVYLSNLTPDGELFLRLPGRHARATLDLGKGPKLLDMMMDTVTIDLLDDAKPAVEVLWRGWYSMGGDYAELETATRFDVHVFEVGQDAWMDAYRAEQRAATRPEGTQVIAAMDDEDDAFALRGEAANKAHREDLEAKRRREDGELGPAVSDSGAVVDDADDEVQISDDAWDDDIRADKADWEEDALAKEAAAREAADKARRKKARDMADEEFGIDREDDEGDGE